MCKSWREVVQSSFTSLIKLLQVIKIAVLLWMLWILGKLCLYSNPLTSIVRLSQKAVQF